MCQKPPPPATFSLTHPAKWHSAPSLYRTGHKGCRDKLTAPCPGGVSRPKGEAAPKHSKGAHERNCDSRSPGGGVGWEGAWGWGRLLPRLRYGRVGW